MRRPNSGLRSNHCSCSRRRTTSPTTASAGGCDARCVGQRGDGRDGADDGLAARRRVPQRITAAGVSGATPLREQLVHVGAQLARGHEEDQRAAALRDRVPVHRQLAACRDTRSR